MGKPIRAWIARDLDMHGATCLFRTKPHQYKDDNFGYFDDGYWEAKEGEVLQLRCHCGLKRGECKRVTILIED